MVVSIKRAGPDHSMDCIVRPCSLNRYHRVYLFTFQSLSPWSKKNVLRPPAEHERFFNTGINLVKFAIQVIVFRSIQVGNLWGRFVKLIFGFKSSFDRCEEVNFYYYYKIGINLVKFVIQVIFFRSIQVGNLWGRFVKIFFGFKSSFVRCEINLKGFQNWD